MADTAAEAWNKGYNAGANHEPESSNPYRCGLAREWLAGWEKGFDPDLEERERDRADR